MECHLRDPPPLKEIPPLRLVGRALRPRLRQPWRLASGSPRKKEPWRLPFPGRADLYMFQFIGAEMFGSVCVRETWSFHYSDLWAAGLQTPRSHSGGRLQRVTRTREQGHKSSPALRVFPLPSFPPSLASASIFPTQAFSA